MKRCFTNVSHNLWYSISSLFLICIFVSSLFRLGNLMGWRQFCGSHGRTTSEGQTLWSVWQLQRAQARWSNWRGWEFQVWCGWLCWILACGIQRVLQSSAEETCAWALPWDSQSETPGSPGMPEAQSLGVSGLSFNGGLYNFLQVSVACWGRRKKSYSSRRKNTQNWPNFSSIWVHALSYFC